MYNLCVNDLSSSSSVWRALCNVMIFRFEFLLILEIWANERIEILTTATKNEDRRRAFLSAGVILLDG